MSPKQVDPAAATDTTLYTVPAATQTIVSTIAVCNRGANNTTFRIAIRPGGAALANAHYLYYDANIGAGVTVAITVGVTLAGGDVVTVRSASGDITFQAFGTEIS